MSDLDVLALETNFKNWRTERSPDTEVGLAFERYAIEAVLLNDDLSDEEIDSGNFGGPDDGGVDGLYLFMNKLLIQDETEVPDNALEVRLVVIQSAFEKSFGEGTIEKLTSFTRDLLDYTRPATSINYLNAEARDAIRRFREKYDAVMADPHQLFVEFYYVTKAENSPNGKVISRGEQLKNAVKQKLSAADVNVFYWTAADVLRAVRSTPAQTRVIRIAQSFQTDDSSAVCLVKLRDMCEFLGDNGTLRKSLFEANVRDYQGRRNPVNSEIRQTLNETDAASEFWWLNNGVTVLATDCSLSGNKLTVKMPSIVNGLQTSHEIFAHFNKHGEKGDNRHVLVRVVIPPDDRIRNKIIKATNFQTSVPETSLYATEPIHFDIEDRLKLYEMFYDRKKGEYRNLRKPIAKIVGIKELAQAVMAMLLQRPNDARGRPMSLLDDKESHKQVFNENYKKDLYVSVILGIRQVDECLKKKTEINRGERRDLRYYMAMLVACRVTGKNHPMSDDLADSVEMFVRPLDEAMIGHVYDITYDAYKKLGGDDTVAKGSELKARLLGSS